MLNISSIAHAIATCGYIGYVPYAPGTVASVVATVVLYCLPVITLPIALVLGLVLFLVSVWSAKMTALFLHHEDPACVVIDEVVGMYIATLCLPKIWWIYALALLLFRIFDIAKPWPINALERITTYKLGIVLDDAFAGLMALVLIKVSSVVFGF